MLIDKFGISKYSKFSLENFKLGDMSKKEIIKNKYKKYIKCLQSLKWF